MDYEYERLNTEILEWQERRSKLMTLSAGSVAAIVTLGQGASDKIPWWTISCPLLLLLSVICRMTALGGYTAQAIGSFLQVFHDPSAQLKWETRQFQASHFIKENLPGRATTHSILFYHYGILGVIAGMFPVFLFKGKMVPNVQAQIDRYHLDFVLVAVCSVIFVHALITMRRAHSSRNKLIAVWENVRDKEANFVGGGPATIDQHGEQVGADQPATRSESKPQVNKKPNRGSNRRSR